MNKVQKNKLFQSAVSGIKKQVQKQSHPKPKQGKQQQKLDQQILPIQHNSQWQEISSGQREKLQSMGAIKKHKKIHKDKAVIKSQQPTTNLNNRLTRKLWQHDKYQKPKFNQTLLSKINNHLNTVPHKNQHIYRQFEIKFEQRLPEKLLLQILKKEKAYIRQYSQNSVVMTNQQAYKDAINIFQQAAIKIHTQKSEQTKQTETPVQEKKKVGIFQRLN